MLATGIRDVICAVDLNGDRALREIGAGAAELSEDVEGMVASNTGIWEMGLGITADGSGTWI